VRFESWEDAASRLRERNREMFPNWTEGEWHRFVRRVCYEAEDGIRFEYDMGIADNFRLAAETPSADAWPMLRALAGRPVTVLRGALSDLLSPATADRMVAELGDDAELVIIPDTGHAPSLEEPEALAALDRLLDRVSARED
jgi:pimeloyl-ACP methyl ester carboxylesterase